MPEPYKAEAMVNSAGKIKEVFIVGYDDVNHCKAVVDNKLCTAIYNHFTGLFYVDDKFGVIDSLNNEKNI